MSPYTIDTKLVDTIERHITASTNDRALLGCVREECPSASLREISRAALYAATDTSREDVRVAARLYYFAVKVRQAA